MSYYGINRPYLDVVSGAMKELKEKGWTTEEDLPSHMAFTGKFDSGSGANAWRIVRFEFRPALNSKQKDIPGDYPEGTEIVVTKYRPS